NQINLTSGRDTTLKGAQVSADKIAATVGRDLTLQSLQDTDNYKSKQTDASAGVSYAIIGSGGSANLSVSKSKLDSKYQSVQEQTGLFAGKGGYQIDVGNHTQLDGSVIASTATPDKNRLSTGTLGWSVLKNKAEYSSKLQSASVSTGSDGSGAFISNMPTGTLIAFNHGDSDSGTTSSAISNGTLDIRDPAKQQQDVATLSHDVEHANGSISPIFDKEKEQKRLRQVQLIADIGTQTVDIVRTQGQLNADKEARAELDKRGIKEPEKDANKEDVERYKQQLIATDAYQRIMADYGVGGNYPRVAQAVTAALQGLVGGDIGSAIAGASAPYLAQVIRKTTGDNTALNTMAHAVLGAVVAQAQGNSALAGGAGATTGEYIAHQMYPGVATADLTQEQRETVVALSGLAAGLVGAGAGGDLSGAVTGAQAGSNAVENNSLSDLAEALAAGKTPQQLAGDRVEAQNEQYKKENCAGMSAEACSVKMYDQRREELKATLLQGADFVPVVGTIKSVVEAESALDYLEASAALIPGERIAAATLKMARKALSRGDLSEASKLISNASNEIQNVKPLDVGSYKDLKKGEVVGDGLEHDHIPSFSALRKAKENELGRKLTPAEEKMLYQNATAVEVPKDVHQAGPTYGGKNTAAQVQQDSLDLCGAVCRDTDALRINMLERGYDPKLVDEAIKKIVDRNRQAGVIK
ncbi:VENN motif pre-toxin domain-containing protein, partial [Pseudomonas poae]